MRSAQCCVSVQEYPSSVVSTQGVRLLFLNNRFGVDLYVCDMGVVELNTPPEDLSKPYPSHAYAFTAGSRIHWEIAVMYLTSGADYT